MKEALFAVDSGTGRRTVQLSAYLDGAAEERAASREHAWIKALRALPVDGEPMRRRFTHRGDSLWWFTELYLHKRRVVLDLFRATAGIRRLLEIERPIEIALVSGDRIIRGIAPQIARQHQVRFQGRAGFGNTRAAVLRTELRAAALTYSALAARLRPRRAPSGQGRIAAFVHRAFWRGSSGEGSEESYIGAVLDALERELPPGDLRYVSVGPGENFAARRWWHALRAEAQPVPAVEAFAPLSALRDSRRLWRGRHTLLRAVWSSAAVREHARVDGVDWWPLVRVELAGVVLLQWTWSARTMDEAGAALDAIRPRAAVTYAEAGGWGRALMLECRRRGIRSIGLQHGFIYRHWLNYLHEPDEMAPLPPSDPGFPRPDLTLLFDTYAAEHLERAGRFPPDSLAVTGSPRLDALIAAVRAVTPEQLARARADAGARDGQALVLVVTKFKEARHLLPELAEAVRGMPDVQFAIKAHPAETPAVYEPAVGGLANARILPADAALAPLIAGSRALVTVNSTLALDAAVLGVPALALGVPNNLSPFVDGGALAGAAPGQTGRELAKILYDEGFRQQLEASRRVFLTRFDIGSDGGAAERSAGAILRASGAAEGRP